MLKYFLLIFSLLLSSCGLVKKLHHSEKEKTTIKTDSTGVKVTKIKTILDTTVKIPGESISGAKPLAAIIAGEPLVLKNNGLEVGVTYNPKTKNLQVQAEEKERTVSVKGKTETEITEKSNVQTTETKKEKKVDNSKERKTSGGFYVGAIVVLVIAILFFLLNRKFRFLIFLLPLLWSCSHGNKFIISSAYEGQRGVTTYSVKDVENFRMEDFFDSSGKFKMGDTVCFSKFKP